MADGKFERACILVGFCITVCPDKKITVKYVKLVYNIVADKQHEWQQQSKPSYCSAYGEIGNYQVVVVVVVGIVSHNGSVLVGSYDCKRKQSFAKLQ
jgi:ferredoxin